MSAISSTAVPRDRRKLIPLALAGGAAAAVGLPLVFLHHGSSSPAPVTPVPAPKTAPAPATPNAKAAPSVHAARVGHSGPLSDPFGRGLAKSTAATVGSGGSAPSPVPSSHTSSPSHASPTPSLSVPKVTAPPSVTPSVPATPEVNPPAASAPKPTATPHVAAPARPRVYRADVRVTGSGLHRRLVRFTALPSIKAPVAVYLGAVHGGRAAFALNRVATASGPARCATMRGPYEAVYLKPGQTERVSIPWFGTTLSMQLALVHLKAQNAASPHAARVANHRVAKGGRALLAQHHLLGTMHFSTLQGFLRAPAKTHACS